LKPRPDPRRDFIKLVDQLAHNHSRYDVFNDFAEMAYCALCKLTLLEPEAEKMEERYMRIVKRHKPDDVRRMPDLLGMTMDGLVEGGDFLGRVATELELLNAHAGQFFTPYDISLMVAEMTLQDAKETIAEQGFITIAEPASGSGGMILAAAEVLKKQGVDIGSQVYVDAIDISSMCFHMAYVQFSLMGIPAIVRLGNTLSLEMYETAGTPALGGFLRQHGEAFVAKMFKKAAA